jgi:hypothetical protein
LPRDGDVFPAMFIDIHVEERRKMWQPRQAG